MPPISPRCAPSKTTPTTPSARPISATGRRFPACSRSSRPTRCCTWPPSRMSTARSTGRASSSRPISTAPLPCSTRRAVIGRLPRERARPVPFPPCLDRRGVRRAGPARQVHRKEPLQAEFALCGVKGRLRPSGARLARDVRPAGGHQQLLEQLRAVPFPGKADPAGDPQGAARRADPGLRQGRQCPRLALRRRPRPRALRGADRGRAGRELQHRLRRRAHRTSTS